MKMYAVTTCTMYPDDREVRWLECLGVYNSRAEAAIRVCQEAIDAMRKWDNFDGYDGEEDEYYEQCHEELEESDKWEVSDRDCEKTRYYAISEVLK